MLFISEKICQPITRAEHEEFKRRLEEENARQDRRIALLEESVSKMGALSTSVEKLALSMEICFMEAFMDDLKVSSSVGNGTLVQMKKKICGGKRTE